RGILLTVPLVLTAYILISAFEYIDGIFGFDETGLGILTFLVVLTALGFLGSTFIAQPIMKYFSGLLDRIPLIKTIYSSIKDLLSAFVGQKKGFTQPVLVRVTEDFQVERIGFVTDEEIEKLGADEGKVAVYLPHSYAFSGNIYIVPRKNLTPINAKSADVMKYIVSGGISSFDGLEEGSENTEYQQNAQN
ncbi:MAG: DUF502 domain-containing protein, partial [Luteibaculum sp.]